MAAFCAHITLTLISVDKTKIAIVFIICHFYCLRSRIIENAFICSFESGNVVPSLLPEALYRTCSAFLLESRFFKIENCIYLTIFNVVLQEHFADPQPEVWSLKYGNIGLPAFHFFSSSHAILKVRQSGC